MSNPKQPQATVSINGVTVKANRVSISNSMESASATCRIAVDAQDAPDLANGRYSVVVECGYAGESLKRAFTGWTDVESPETWPYANEIVALGYKAYLSLPAPRGRSYAALPGLLTDTDILNDLAALVGLSADITGSERALVTAHAERVDRHTGSVKALWDRIGKVCNLWTADQRDGTVRCAPWNLGAGGGADGALGDADILEKPRWEKNQSGARNGVQVLGYVFPDDSLNFAGELNPFNRPFYALVDSSSTFPLGGGGNIQWADPIQDDLIETTDDAITIAHAWMDRLDKIANRLTVPVAGDCSYEVGQTYDVTISGIAGVDGDAAIVIAVTDEWDMEQAQATSTLTLERLIGGTGDPFELAPTVDLSVAGAGTESVETAVVVTSLVSSGPFDVEWSNNANGKTYSGTTEDTSNISWAFFDDEQISGRTITVIVTDPETRVRSMVTVDA